MQLKSQQEIDAAMKPLPDMDGDLSNGKVTQKRATVLVATVRATRPEKMDELDAIFSESLSDEEKAFLSGIVTGWPNKPAEEASHESGSEPDRQ